MPTNLWLSNLLEEQSSLQELAGKRETMPFSTPDSRQDTRCAICKGSKLLCGKDTCPILVKFYAQMKTKPLIDSLTLEGSSPPDLFVGRMGYPYVNIGPLIPPVTGDTTLLGTPEMWQGKSIEEIAEFRFQLVRGKYRVNVRDVDAGKIVELTRELALSKAPTEVDAEFRKKPVGRIALDDEVQPFGPSAPLKNIDLISSTADHKIEKAFSDTDMRASEAVIQLYRDNVLVSKIQRAFSAGLFGIEKNRRFVPTRWSITAVDSMLSKNLLDEVKTFPLINEFRVYEHTALDNRWIALMIPSRWSYELIEAWYPRTIWNPGGSEIAIFSDCEGYGGRSEYPDIGGCYFSARLAVVEQLKKERRQAAAIILREAHPGYIMPVGVWNVREAVRNAVKKTPMKFATLKEAFAYIFSKFDISVNVWIRNSKLLQEALFQKKIQDYL
ncbi:MAG: Nre family DNA repair protein [Candidatus Micrarchaeota archaeon]|nr:Nre family DNA repair protein [Candidatus Micrarchaeota archaeon]